MEIPIQNIYYLLSYAWNKLPESKIVNVDHFEGQSIIELLAKVLCNGISKLIKLGLDRDYIDRTEELTTIRGSIDFNTTLQKTFFSRPSLFCEFDELSHNILHNQILKTIVYRLLGLNSLNKELHDELLMIFRRLSEIDIIPLTKRHFGLVQLHSNNSFYDFLMKVCELIHDNYFISEDDGQAKFRDFMRDDRAMARLFEEFVRNFYKKEQQKFEVSRRDIQWDAEATNEALAYLPKMQTDIFLDSSERKIIIDTKYYSEAFQYHYDKQKIKNENLYQLLAYLTNAEAGGSAYLKCEGILIYPTVQNENAIPLNIKGHPVKFVTINLNQNWQNINNDLLAIIDLN